MDANLLQLIFTQGNIGKVSLPPRLQEFVPLVTSHMIHPLAGAFSTSQWGEGSVQPWTKSLLHGSAWEFKDKQPLALTHNPPDKVPILPLMHVFGLWEKAKEPTQTHRTCKFDTERLEGGDQSRTHNLLAVRLQRCPLHPNIVPIMKRVKNDFR